YIDTSTNDNEDEISQMQREAFLYFTEAWPDLQEKLIEALMKYYNEEERFSYGPDDEEELAEWWPEIETKEALLEAVTLETIVVASDRMMKKVKNGRCIYLLFSRSWGGEDWDDNGVGVCCVNEGVDEIAYKDIAY
ncbi:MAG: hypothetical protein K2M91_12855, partial [Lachnospiraceae bacterium]|nr:hypothetical protein [Lachnospiraceae bacterium]